MFGIGLFLIAAGVLVIVYAMQGKPVFNLSRGVPEAGRPPRGEPIERMRDGG